MKNLNKMTLVAALTAIFSLANQASAQSSVGYRPTGDDGITASPRLRQQLDERKHVATVTSATVASVGYKPTGDDGITASPKVRQMLDARKAAESTPSTGYTAVASVGYQPTGPDGITASPKLRQQLNEHAGQSQFMIAPLKNK